AVILKQQIETAGHSVVVDNKASLAALKSQQWDGVIICTSSTGKGQIPNNLVSFYDELGESLPSLANIKFGVIALGNSSHANFCGAGELVEKRFSDLQATCLVPKVTIDATETKTPERDAKFWLKEFLATM
ncbi:MAG: MioC protein, partial [Granulosicoccus sp.]